MLQRLYYHVIVGVLDILLTVGLILSSFLRFEVGSQRADHVHVQTSDVIVVVMDVLILALVLLLKFFDSPVLLSLNLRNLCLTLGLHVFSQPRHLCLVLLLDLACYPLVLFALLS